MEVVVVLEEDVDKRAFVNTRAVNVESGTVTCPEILEDPLFP